MDKEVKVLYTESQLLYGKALGVFDRWGVTRGAKSLFLLLLLLFSGRCFLEKRFLGLVAAASP